MIFTTAGLMTAWFWLAGCDFGIQRTAKRKALNMEAARVAGEGVILQGRVNAVCSQAFSRSPSELLREQASGVACCIPIRRRTFHYNEFLYVAERRLHCRKAINRANYPLLSDGLARCNGSMKEG